jgi:cysteine desulfurase
MTSYLDCNATTPLDPAVQEAVLTYMADEFGNAGSRTHEFGMRAKQAVVRAREQVAKLAHCREEEVLFTSGATEANNLALLGLAAHGEQSGKRHLVTAAIEHKAVLEPLQYLADARGFTLTVLPVGGDGCVDPAAVQSALRPDTLLVSVMHANNETGVVQPLADICRVLVDHPAFLHVDAAQGFGKLPADLTATRIDLCTMSGHKLFAPKGIGALVARRRGFNRPPLKPLMYGGGQERGLRPGTLPVHLIVGLGLACDLARSQHVARAELCRALRAEALAALQPLGAVVNGDPARCLPHVLNLSFTDLDSEAVMLAWKGVIACSNGSACTSSSYTPSHVLTAMGLAPERIRGALRLSWCHLTEPVDWAQACAAIAGLRG